MLGIMAGVDQKDSFPRIKAALAVDTCSGIAWLVLLVTLHLTVFPYLSAGPVWIAGRFRVQRNAWFDSGYIFAAVYGALRLRGTGTPFFSEITSGYRIPRFLFRQWIHVSFPVCGGFCTNFLLFLRGFTRILRSILVLLSVVFSLSLVRTLFEE